MRLEMEETESPEQDNHGYGGEKSRKYDVMEGVINLGPHRAPRVPERFCRVDSETPIDFLSTV
jgi:hypothetical protein